MTSAAVEAGEAGESQEEWEERARHTRKGEPPVVAAAHGRVRKQADITDLQQRELLVASGGRGGATHRRHRCVLR